MTTITYKDIESVKPATSGNHVKDIFSLIVKAGIEVVVGLSEKDNSRLYVNANLGATNLTVYSYKVNSTGKTHLDDLNALLGFCGLELAQVSLHSRASKALSEENPNN